MGEVEVPAAKKSSAAWISEFLARARGASWYIVREAYRYSRPKTRNRGPRRRPCRRHPPLPTSTTSTSPSSMLVSRLLSPCSIVSLALSLFWAGAPENLFWSRTVLVHALARTSDENTLSDEPINARNPDTGLFSLHHVQQGCLRGGVQNGPQFLTFHDFRDHFNEFYNSGAEIYVGGLASTLLTHQHQIAEMCPPIVLQSLVLELENVMALTYTDAYSEIAVQQKRLKSAAALMDDFKKLYYQLIEDLGGYADAQELMEDWPNILAGWDRADKYRQWFHEDIAAGESVYADHLGEGLSKQGNMTDTEFGEFFWDTFRDISRIFSAEMG